METSRILLCRTCLLPRAELIDMEQTVPNISRRMTYDAVLRFCVGPLKAEQYDQSGLRASHICVHCSKALLISYNFLQIVFDSDSVMEGKQVYNVMRAAMQAIKIAEVVQGMFVAPDEERANIENMQYMFDLQQQFNLESTDEDRTVNENIQLESMECMDLEVEDTCDNDKEYPNVGSLESLSENGEKELQLENSNSTESENSSSTDISTNTIDGDYKENYSPGNSNDSCAEEPNLSAEESNSPESNASTESDTKDTEDQLDGFLRDQKFNDEHVFIKYKNVPNSPESNASTDSDTKDTEDQLDGFLRDQKFNDEHVFTKYKNVHGGITPLRCQYCNYFTCYPESLRKHCKKMHNIEASNTIIDAPVNPLQLPDENEYHKITYKCTECSHESHILNDVIDHLIVEHDTMVNAEFFVVTHYNCSECPRKCKSERALRNHRCYAHGKRDSKRSFKRLRCQQCGEFPKEADARANGYTSDQVLEIPGDPKVKKHDRSTAILEEHETKEPLEKVYQCDYCVYTSDNYSDFEHHHYKHFEATYKCIVCPRKFVSTRFMSRHALNKHDILLFDEELVEMARNNMDSGRADTFAEAQRPSPRAAEDGVTHELPKFGPTFECYRGNF